MDRKKILEVIENEEVKFARLQFTDILGTVKSVSIPSEKLLKAFEKGIWFDGSSIQGFVRIDESDMRLKPDPETFSLLPWKDDRRAKTARLICDVIHPDGEKFSGDPRTILKKTIRKAEEMGFKMKVGPEPEFFIFEKENGSPSTKPHDFGGYFDLDPKDLANEIREEIIFDLEGLGFGIEASHHEVASGQHEINFTHDDALRTADRIATFRTVVRSVAERHGLHATFMPKPVQGINGSGMHLHLSLFDCDGNNTFFDPNDEFDLSGDAYYFIAGLLKHAPAITAICNPLVNSYKRLLPGYEAPVYMAWSDVNRSALIRKPGSKSPENSRIELRSPDPSCNPYLALSVILEAGLDGIKNELECPDPIQENIYEFTEAKRKEKSIQKLPGSLKEAISALKEDELIRGALGKHVYKKFLEAKEKELAKYKKQVTQWEKNNYLKNF